MGWRASQVGEAVGELLGEGTAPVLGTIETLFAEAPQVRQPMLRCDHAFCQSHFQGILPPQSPGLEGVNAASYKQHRYKC